MKRFNQWMESRIDALIKLTFNSKRMLLNFYTPPFALRKPKNPHEPQIVVTDKEFIKNLLGELSDDDRALLMNGIPVTLSGIKADKLIKDNIGRQEIGWDHVARYYGIKEDTPAWVGEITHRISVILGTKSGGTEGAGASLHAYVLDEKGGYKQARDPRLGTSTTFLHPGTWIRNIKAGSSGTYRLEASEDNGRTWGKYEVEELPIVEELDPIP